MLTKIREIIQAFRDRNKVVISDVDLFMHFPFDGAKGDSRTQCRLDAIKQEGKTLVIHCTPHFVLDRQKQQDAKNES